MSCLVVAIDDVMTLELHTYESTTRDDIEALGEPHYAAKRRESRHLP